jgi:hypothetical protein
MMTDPLAKGGMFRPSRDPSEMSLEEIKGEFRAWEQAKREQLQAPPVDDFTGLWSEVKIEKERNDLL